MRFGVSGATVPNNMHDVTPEACRRIREQGFSGVFCRFYHNDPFTTTRDECQRARDVFAESGVELYQVTGYQPCLVNLD